MTKNTETVPKELLTQAEDENKTLQKRIQDLDRQVTELQKVKQELVQAPLQQNNQAPARATRSPSITSLSTAAEDSEARKVVGAQDEAKLRLRSEFDKAIENG